MVQTIVTYCDWCIARGEEVPAVSWQISLTPPGARKARSFAPDVCETCAKRFVDLLEDLGESRPAEVEAPERRPYNGGERRTMGGGEFECPAEGCDAAYRHKSSLTSHTRQVHGQTPNQILGKPAGHRYRASEA